MPDRPEIDVVAALARHAAAVRVGDIPASALERAKAFILDSLAVGIAGSGAAHADRLARVAAFWGAGAEAGVWGGTGRLPAPSAALANAYRLHALEWDCVHEAAVVHPMAAVLPALLAVAERRAAAGDPVPGADFLAATVVGVDVAVSLGLAAAGPMTFYRAASCGVFGATAALASLARLDAERTRDALGLAYAGCGGAMQAHLEGAPALPLQVGYAARAAVTAADLAAAGFPGPRDVATGPYGFFALFERGASDLEAVAAALGRRWRVAELSHKPFPCGRLTHGVVDALMRLGADDGVAPADVASVRCLVPPLVHRLVGRPDVPDPATTYARLCLPFVAGTFLARGRVGLADFTDPERLADPAVHARAACVEVVRDANPDENAMVPQTVIVRLADGRIREIVLERILGHPDAPLGRDAALEKVGAALAEGVHPLPPGRTEALVDIVDGLEAAPDAAVLAHLAVAG